MDITKYLKFHPNLDDSDTYELKVIRRIQECSGDTLTKEDAMSLMYALTMYGITYADGFAINEFNPAEDNDDINLHRAADIAACFVADPAIDGDNLEIEYWWFYDQAPIIRSAKKLLRQFALRPDVVRIDPPPHWPPPRED